MLGHRLIVYLYAHLLLREVNSSANVVFISIFIISDGKKKALETYYFIFIKDYIDIQFL